MFAITGATGHLGRLTIAALLKRVTADRVVALVRDPSRAADLASSKIEMRHFDYDNPAALGSALAGVERLLLISSNDIGSRVPQHRAVIDAAIAAGIGFVAYTSVLNADNNPLVVAPSHRETEAMLRDSGLPHAILRNGWYHENYLLGAEAAIAHGALLGSTGDGHISGAARADYAEAAAAVLVAGPKAAGTHELAGDEAYTLTDVAAALADASGRRVTYRDLPEADYAFALEQSGIPASFAAILAGLSAGAAGGILTDDSRTLSRLIGRPTTSLQAVVRAAIGRSA
jgi:NAD(P)H dehydrogenase (quinone)